MQYHSHYLQPFDKICAHLKYLTGIFGIFYEQVSAQCHQPAHSSICPIYMEKAAFIVRDRHQPKASRGRQNHFFHFPLAAMSCLYTGETPKSHVSPDLVA